MLSSNADDTTLLHHRLWSHDRRRDRNAIIIIIIIYSLLKTSLSTVLAVLRKENTITSCLMLNSHCIKTKLFY